MELFGYSGHIRRKHVVGVVKANSISEAKEIVKNAYVNDNFDLWENVVFERIRFSDDNCHEIYYGL